MRAPIIVVSAALALWGCATPEGVQRQALNNCQAVGITEKDPQFATCMRAFKLQYSEERLEHDYNDALIPVRQDRRSRHDRAVLY
jgi:hypothetical protein